VPTASTPSAVKKPPARPTLLLLVRHGITPTTGVKLPGRAPGLHLSEEGRRQAEAAAQRIAGLAHVTAVYASPLERARETAAPIARARQLAVRIERDLTDLDNGDWTGLTLERARRRPEWEIVQRHPSGFRFPGGESFMEMQTRMTGAVGRLVERHRGATVVVVSHADPIKALVAHALGTPLDLFQRIVVAPASITVVAWGRGSAAVLALNSLDGALTAYGPA
jgi:probable phosphoglycerate mutase